MPSSARRSALLHCRRERLLVTWQVPPLMWRLAWHRSCTRAWVLACHTFTSRPGVNAGSLVHGTCGKGEMAAWIAVSIALSTLSFWSSSCTMSATQQLSLQMTNARVSTLVGALHVHVGHLHVLECNLMACESQRAALLEMLK